jgi:hypothetical protein
MSMNQDKTGLPQANSQAATEEFAAIVREAHRLRRQAVASVAAALARRLKRSLRPVRAAPPRKAAV